MRMCNAIWILIGLGSLLVSCVDYSPKPRGYLRIDLQEPVYVSYSDTRFPFSFHVSDQVSVSLSTENTLSWLDLFYPALNARVYCGYSSIRKGNLTGLVDESRLLVGRSARDVRDVLERDYEDPERAVYGSLFLLGDQSASPVQFYLTDSIQHFFRGALYFDHVVPSDSLKPVVDYLTHDVIELMESFNWK